MPRRFISEPIKPITGEADAAAMALGEPGLPHKFLWRDVEYTVAEVLSAWRETSDCRSGSPEQYVRKHWFDIRTTDGHQMRLYFDRQPRSKRDRKVRWWLHTVWLHTMATAQDG